MKSNIYYNVVQFQAKSLTHVIMTFSAAEWALDIKLAGDISKKLLK